VFRAAFPDLHVSIEDLVAALSVVSDLTRGHPVGEAMRACLLAAELAGGPGTMSIAGARSITGR